jgi:hypothetical protein
MEEQAQGLSKTVAVFRIAGDSRKPVLAAPAKTRAPVGRKAVPGAGKPAGVPPPTLGDPAAPEEWEEF